jgi:NAD(P)H dehydrogenase (quinone)
MILITGAAGKTGRAVIRALVDRGQVIQALVFRSEHGIDIEGLGVKSVLVGDMRDAALLESAMQGVRSVYHICPNVHPDEIAIGQKMIAAASAAGISHFVYHSVLHPQTEAMPHHWKKLRVEEGLFESGLSYTILQPAPYMQNILANWRNIVDTGSFSIPYAVESRISMVDLDDVALAAATVLIEEDPETQQPLHRSAVYELVGTQAMTQAEVAAILSNQLGRPVIAEVLPVEAWERKARASGLGDDQVATLLKMFKYYENYGLAGNPHVLGWLLNRPPTSLEAFAKRVAEVLLPSAP